MANITSEQFTAMAPRANAALLAPLNAAIVTYGINQSPETVAAYLATILEESGNLTVFLENLNYPAAQLLKQWPTHFNAANVNDYAHKPEKIANRAYANRYSNGDEASGDGWRYRGRGAMQLTFKANYAAFATKAGVDAVAHPELLEQPQYFTESDAYFWHRAGCNQLATGLRGRNDAHEQGVLKAICLRVNGGLMNFDTRVANYWRVLHILHDSPNTPPPIPGPDPA